MYTAGDDTGLELAATCIYATEEMAKTLLSMAKGSQYQMYEAQAANLDPAAELGDGIEVGGITSVIAQINDNGDGYPDVSASGEQEVEDEYPGASRQGPIQRELARARSLISKTNDRISLEIYGEDGKGGLSGKMSTFTVALSWISGRIDGVEGNYTQFKADLEGISAELHGVEDDVTYLQLDLEGITGRVEDAEGNIGALQLEATNLRAEIAGKINDEEAQALIDLSLDNLTLSVSNNATSSTITLKAGEAEIDSATIRFTGVVTFSALEDAPGKDDTIINGGWIDTDTLFATNLMGE